MGDLVVADEMPMAGSGPMKPLSDLALAISTALKKMLTKKLLYFYLRVVYFFKMIPT